MALRDIVYLGDPVLREEAAPLSEEEFGDDLKLLIQDMFETMYAAEGIGLAAPQIGISKRILVLDIRDDALPNGGKLALVNARVVESSKKTGKEVEGCLSIPGVDDSVERPLEVVVAGLNEDGEPVELEASGLFSRALQHEIDHLDGILFPDRLSPLKRRMLLKRWKRALEDMTPEERARAGQS
jgi:peptide deformylase